MRRFILIALLTLGTLSGCHKHHVKQPVLQIIDPHQYVYRVSVDDQISIRFLILKHAPDQIANEDGDFAIRAMNVGVNKGLAIKDIGNFHINSQGRTNESWSEPYSDLEGLKSFINKQAKIGAREGDTLMVYTIGHGGGDGNLMRLGQRKNLMKVLAEVAEENDQKIFWWQLSCHAAANLPSPTTLTEAQQPLFSMTASSPANELSWSNTQAQLMQKMFVSLADKNTDIDPDQDGDVTAEELKNFMIRNYGHKRGSLMYAADPQQVIFGIGRTLANKIPIVDKNNPQGEYPKDYIPFPKK